MSAMTSIVVCVGVLIGALLWLKARAQAVGSASSDPRPKARPKAQPTARPIKSDEYQRWILVQGTTEAYLLRMISEYGALYPSGESLDYQFEVAQHNGWHALLVDQRLSFYVYHNLVCWLVGYEDSPELPKRSVGFAHSALRADDDYLFYVDPESEAGDTEVGVFRSGEGLSVYLPEAFEAQGNMITQAEPTRSFKEEEEALTRAGIELSSLAQLSATPHKVRMSV